MGGTSLHRPSRGRPGVRPGGAQEGRGADTASWNFTSFDEAIAFIKLNPDRYVIKPSGKAQNEKELLFVGQEEDGKDVEQVLEHYRKKWSSKIKVFLLQKYAQGVEIAVGAFFNGTEFVRADSTSTSSTNGSSANDIRPSRRDGMLRR